MSENKDKVFNQLTGQWELADHLKIKNFRQELAHKIVKQILYKEINPWKEQTSEYNEELHRLLPIQMSYAGWLNNSWTFDIHPEYAKRMKKGSHLPSKAFTKWDIKYKEFRDIEQMESVVREYITYTKEYNSWVQGIIEDDRNKVFAEIPIDKDGYITTGDYATAQVKINELQYEIYPLPEPPLYKVEVQTESPHFRKVDDYDVVNLVYLDDEFLFKQLQKYKDIDQFCIAVNLLMFEHIQRMVKVAKDNNDWNKDNIYYLPNKEFVRYFQEKGIDPSDESIGFNDAIVNLYRLPSYTPPISSDEAKGKLLMPKGVEELKIIEYSFPDKSYAKLAQMAEQIYYANQDVFDSKIDTYRHACRWWKLYGDNYPEDGVIIARQLATALSK